jgi:hypothetical protein
MADCASNFQIRSDMRIADGHNRDHRNLGHQKFSITLRDGFAIAGQWSKTCEPRTTAQAGGGRWKHGPFPRLLGTPFVHLTASRAAHWNSDARKAFEQNPLSLKTC